MVRFVLADIFEYKENNRENWIDYAKCIAMFLVVLGHVGTGNPLSLWIYSFHIPLFFWLSGAYMTYRSKWGGYKEYAIKMIRTTLVPYFLYSIIYLLYDVYKIFVSHKGLFFIWKDVLGIFINLRGSEYSIGLWFLPLIFLSKLLSYLILSSFYQNSVRNGFIGITMVCLLGMQFLYAFFIGVRLPWGADVVPIGAFFIIAGFVFTKYKVRIWKVANSIKPLIIVFLFLLNFWTNRVNLRMYCNQVDLHALTFGNPVLFLVSSFAGILFCILICKDFLNRFKIGLLQYVGTNTLHIYAMHGLIVSIVKKIMTVLFDVRTITILLQVVLSLIVVLVCCAFLSFCRYIYSHKMVRFGIKNR